MSWPPSNLNAAHRIGLWCVCLLIAFTLPTVAQSSAEPAVPPPASLGLAPPLDDPTLNLDARLGDIKIDESGPAVSIHFHGRDYTAEQYLRLVASQQHRRDEGGWVFIAFNITTLAGVLWVSIGLLGQLLFTGRMIIQWLVSEKEHRSVVPPIFWYLSLIGATMLLAYFIWRKDLVGILGQATGFFIYIRNVYLIHSNRRARRNAPPAVA